MSSPTLRESGALGFVEIRLAPVHWPRSPPRHISQRFRNPAAIGQELTCLLKVRTAVS
jgi:hypothetical protein